VRHHPVLGARRREQMADNSNLKITVMKKMINILILGSSLMLAPITAVAMKSIPDTFILEIDGRILNASAGDGMTTIEVLSNNAVVETILLREKRNFRLNLKKNSKYTIRLSKRGFVTRLICVDTSLPEAYEDLYRFSFETKLMSEMASEKLNKEYLDLPIAMVFFNEKKGCFYYSKEYTSNLKKTLAMR
jgi:hypothetical protein